MDYFRAPWGRFAKWWKETWARQHRVGDAMALRPVMDAFESVPWAFYRASRYLNDEEFAAIFGDLRKSEKAHSRAHQSKRSRYWEELEERYDRILPATPGRSATP